MLMAEPVRDSAAVAQVWQELFDRQFPQGVNVKSVGSDGRLQPPNRNLPVVVVMELAGEWPVLRGFPIDAPQGLDFWLTPTTWQVLDRPIFAVRVSQGGDDPDMVLSARISESLAAEMAPLRDYQREMLMTQARSAAQQALAERLGVSTEQAPVSDPDAPRVRLSAQVAGLLYPAEEE
jgi:hypothetical protein